MYVTHKGKPGRIIPCGAYFHFAGEDNKDSFTVEPNYTIEYGPLGMVVRGFKPDRNYQAYRRKEWVIMYDYKRMAREAKNLKEGLDKKTD